MFFIFSILVFKFTCTRLHLRTATRPSVIGISAASEISRAAREHFINGNSGGRSVRGPHEDPDFFQAAKTLLSQSIRGAVRGFGRFVGAKNGAADEWRDCFHADDFLTVGARFVLFCLEIC